MAGPGMMIIAFWMRYSGARLVKGPEWTMKQSKPSKLQGLLEYCCGLASQVVFRMSRSQYRFLMMMKVEHMACVI